MDAVKMGMTIEEAAECTGIGRNTMRKLVDWGKLPVLKAGRKTIITEKTAAAIFSAVPSAKPPNVKGRISYITSHARQENLYATYRTADNAFWSNLARESQQEFQRSGVEGKCIEARELIIALPEGYTQYEPQQVLKDFTDEFRRWYGVKCVSALHHNKRKTNYHIHLIFSERKLLPKPDVKIATRSAYSLTKQAQTVAGASQTTKSTKEIL